MPAAATRLVAEFQPGWNAGWFPEFHTSEPSGAKGKMKDGGEIWREKETYLGHIALVVIEFS